MRSLSENTAPEAVHEDYCAKCISFFLLTPAKVMACCLLTLFYFHNGGKHEAPSAQKKQWSVARRSVQFKKFLLTSTYRYRSLYMFPIDLKTYLEQKKTIIKIHKEIQTIHIDDEIKSFLNNKRILLTTTNCSPSLN